METVKRKRGRPKKVKLPEEVLLLVDTVLEKSELLPQEVSKKKDGEWDVPLGTPIEFFDANLSYELTGYRPINETQGLDFKPEWFTEARDTYKRTGHYCSYRFKSKPYNDFWKELYRRCRDGYTVNGYTITGDNYFFLNFYTLPVIEIGLKSGSGTKDDFPIFFASQYTFFHYYEMAKRLHLHAALMKARSIGFSEINAAIATNMFITIRQSNTMITCYDEKKLKRTYKKFTHALTFLDSKTDGGMFRLRLLEDSALTKKSGRWENINGQKVASGFQSCVSGVNGNDPGNIRGDRVDLLIYDESGCHAPGTEVVMYDGTLKKVEDIQIGDILMGDDGTPRNVLELHHGYQLMYKIIPKVGDTLIVNANHILYGKHRDYYRKTYKEFTMRAENYYNMVANNPEKLDVYKLIHSNPAKLSKNQIPDSTFTIEKVGIGEYYGFSLDGNQLFLLKDFTVCHNSWPNLTTAIVLGQELVEVQGIPRGVMLFGGTGGDSGKNLEGLRTIYYNPEAFKILPYRHNYSQTGETVITGYFIPYFAQSLDPQYMDSRGVCKVEEFKKVLQEERNKLAKIPSDYIKKCAERCWNAEEAFNLEGDNKFNKIVIAEQLAQIRALKKAPPIERGYIEYKFKNNEHTLNNIDGFKWILNLNSKIQILEHPIWTLSPIKDENGKVIWNPPTDKIRNLYVIGIDGIDIGAAQTSENTKDPSDFCLVVYKRAYGLEEPKFVALYKDRPNDIRECYKIAIKLAQYYNAIINIEATRLSIIPYARERKLLSLFMKRPRATLADAARNTNKLYGTPATPAIIDHQTDLIADYINDYCHLIWFDEMLDEFNRYTDENKRKFDIVAAAAMSLLADEELQGIVPKATEVVKDEWKDIGYYTDAQGHRRYGVLQLQQPLIRFNNNFGYSYDSIGPRTSNTRLLNGYIS